MKPVPVPMFSPPPTKNCWLNVMSSRHEPDVPTDVIVTLGDVPEVGSAVLATLSHPNAIAVSV